MPQTTIHVFKEANGEVPLTEWLNILEKRNNKAFTKALAAVLLLEAHGYELHRPYCATLRDGVYELRWKVVHVNYRILYFFHDKNAVCLSHGFTKESEVPDKDIDLAVERKKLVEKHGQKHLADWEE